MIEWSLKGESYGSCNCDHACPCQFEGLPTHYACKGFEVFRVHEGYFGDVDLAGVKAAVVYSWPGPIYEGGGITQAIIDPAASDAQRDAISRIVKGQETKEGVNTWWVFHTMSETVLDDVFLPIELEMDIESRTARVSIPGYLEAIGDPIRSPVDGKPHRVQIRCPEGIEFDTADIGNGVSTEITGPIPIQLQNTYGQWNAFDHNNYGPAHNR
jgi:hypothetical protein